MPKCEKGKGQVRAKTQRLTVGPTADPTWFPYFVCCHARRLFAKPQGDGESRPSSVEEGMLNQARAFPYYILVSGILLAIASTLPDLLQLCVPIQHVLMSRLAVPIRALGTVSRFA